MRGCQRECGGCKRGAQLHHHCTNTAPPTHHHCTASCVVVHVTDRMCVLCWERQRCMLLLPCMHYPLCAECVDEMKDNRSGVTLSCPMCRAMITSDLETSPAPPQRLAPP